MKKYIKPETETVETELTHCCVVTSPVIGNGQGDQEDGYWGLSKESNNAWDDSDW